MSGRNKKVMVLGMGKTGQAVCAFLQKEGVETETYDDALSIEAADRLCDCYDYAVISPGISLTHPIVLKVKECGVPVLSEIDLAYIHCPSTHVFAVSGTNGKTTTCTVLHKLLSSVWRSFLVGNVGTPWIERVGAIGKKDTIVLEISSFQIEQSQFFRPEIAALTNVGEDHLDRHLTKERYQSVKLSLLERSMIKVVNSGDPLQRGVTGAITYSVTDPAADYYLSGRAIYHNGKRYSLPSLSLGAGYDADYLCAFAVASTYCGVKKEFLTLYDKVKIPPFRCQHVGKLCGADVYNDSKGTNVDATIFAAGRLSVPTALILGGSDKGEDYSRLFAGLKENVQRIYLCGANARDILLAAPSAMYERCRMMPTLEACVEDFVKEPLQALLFSPASASFDKYKNYEERGMIFNEIVAKYKNAFERVPK